MTLWSSSSYPAIIEKNRTFTVRGVIRDVIIAFLIIVIITPTNRIVVEGAEPPTTNPLPLFNVGLNRPITVLPSEVTCGTQVPTVFCQSTESQDSLTNCLQELCSTLCPWRSTTPAPSLLLQGAANVDGSCVRTDSGNVAPTPASQSSVSFVDAGSQCYLSPVPTSNQRLGLNSSLTLSAWLWPTSRSGTIIEKNCRRKDGSFTSTFKLQVSRTGFTLSFNSSMLTYVEEVINVDLPLNAWSFIALQIYSDKLSFFLNCTDGLPKITLKMKATVEDDGNCEASFFRIGQDFAGGQQYVGWMQDLRYYNITLSNREIAGIYSGSVPKVRIQSDCFCPGQYPRDDGLNCYENDFGNRESVGRLSQLSHVLEMANDGDASTYFLTNPVQGLIIEIDLGDEFEIFFVKIAFYSPLPDWLKFEKTTQLNGTFKEWQYYARDCYRSFNMETQSPLKNSSSVNCLELDSLSVPFLSGGSVTFSLLSPDRPGYQNPEQTPELIEFMKANRVRISMSGHLSGLSLRHSYFGINEIEIIGRCDCGGHASTCNVTNLPYECSCLASSNTEGKKCQRCKALYNNKAFSQNSPCQLCECHNHSQSCTYEPSADPFPTNSDLGGGGVCDECQDNTEGFNCQSCVTKFYRPEGVSLSAKDVCQPCNCSFVGPSDECEKVGGQCACRVNVVGRTCDRCKEGFFNLQSSNPAGCEDCSCNRAGSALWASPAYQCYDPYGQCPCKTFVEGVKCDRCMLGFFGLDASDPRGCRPCNCNAQRSLSPACDQTTGQCQCRENFSGLTCDTCIDNYYLVPTNQLGSCRQCNCDLRGSVAGSFCNKVTGSCACQQNVIGSQCNTCMENYFNLTSNGCQPCRCDLNGVANLESICDVITGSCKCLQGVEGSSCNRCKSGYYKRGSPGNETNPCTPCDCDAIGTFACDPDSGRCNCKPNRTGQKCDSCLDGFYADISGTCIPCVCNESGTIANSNCNPGTGQCQCKGAGSGIGGLTCDQCLPSFWGFDVQLGRCQPCLCDSSGSVNSSCDASTGQCNCKLYTTARQCNLCIEGTSGLSYSNPFGCSKAPGGIMPVSAKVLSSKFIFLVWEPPMQPNGILENYGILRNRILIFNSSRNATVTEYNDTSVTPYTKYTYVLLVKNDFGQSQSVPVTFETLQDIPAGSSDIKILEKTSRQIKISWQAPISKNGVIIKYVVRQISGFNEQIQQINDSTPYAIRFQGLAVQAIIDLLTPYSNVTLDLQSCTVVGCLTSNPVSTITLEDAPANQDPPKVQTINSSSLMITWLPPKQPNGIIIFYELWMKKQESGSVDNVGPAALVFHPFGRYDPLFQSSSSSSSPLQPPATNFTVTNLEPFTYYAFKVASESSRGKTESAWTANFTGEAAPSFVSTPNVTSINSSSLEVSWSNRSSRINGIVRSFSVCYAIGQNETLPWKCIELGPNTFSQTLNNLQSYTNVTILLIACNSVSCKNSSKVVATVAPSAPEDISTPLVIPRNATSFTITWSPPQISNGPPSSYAVVRTSPPFNDPPLPVEVGDEVVPFNGIGYYRLPADTLPQDSFYTGIKFSFRTFSTDGLILLATTPGTQIEYVAVYLKNGALTFAFNTQDCPTVIEWKDGSLDMNSWQYVNILRLGNYASIQVNQGDPEISNSSCSNQMIGKNSGFYVGGLPADFFFSSFSSLQNFNFKNFHGCLANLSIMTQGPPLEEIWNPVNWQNIEKSENNVPKWMGCKIGQQAGIRFMGTGFLSISIDSLNGRSLADVFFTFKTQSQNGLILFAHGAIGSFYAVYMWAGLLNWNVSINGVLTNYVYNSTPLCDGKFHPIRLVIDLPSGFMELNVDGNKYVQQLSGDANSRASGFILSSYLHVGGLSKIQDVMHFIQRSGLQWLRKYHFSGCIDPAMRIASGQIMSSGRVVDGLDIDLSGCPTFSTVTSNNVGCQSEDERFKILHNESNFFSFVDSGLNKFTEYMYSIQAYNYAGRTESQWTLSRTLEGAPSIVPSPNVDKLSKGQLQVTWTAPNPQFYTGSISNYIVKFYCRGNPTSAINNNSFTTDQCSENETVTGGNQLSALVTYALPHTEYEVRLTACTRGGCTEGNGTIVLTDPDAPWDMRPPFVLTSGPSYIVASWFRPGRINGELLGFSLNMRSSLVYSGLLTSYNVTDLSVFTSYTFNVMVCNTFKCTTSEDVLLMTSQLPPTSVDPPRVTFFDAKKIRVDWTRPLQVNGILRFYFIYLSRLIGKPGLVAYNSSDPGVTTAFLTDLVPDATYYVSLTACTDAGCNGSKQTPVKMPEGVPEDVPNPVVMAIGPTQLKVTWSAPLKPNGVILNYLVFQDDFLLVNASSPSNQLINGLQPWSRHTFQVKVCTAKGCSQSSEVTAFTSEAPPEGTVQLRISTAADNDQVDDLQAKVLSMKLVLKKVRALWSPIQQPNSLAVYSLFFDGPFYDLEGVITPSSFDFKRKSSKQILFSTNSTLVSGSWITVGGLLPFSTYTSYVNVSNGVGFVLSNYVTVTTAPAEPDGLKAPMLTSPTPNSILASWSGPMAWNSNENPLTQLQFKVSGWSDNRIVNIFSSPTAATAYFKNDLLPFTSYMFRLVAFNSFGSKFSDWTELVTRQDVPGGLDAPTLQNITSRTVTLSWQPPLAPNGLIISYQLLLSDGVQKSFSGNTTMAVLDGLTPFSNYSFVLGACTVAGCTMATPTGNFTTDVDVPEGVSINSIESPTSSSVMLTWKAPSEPNGIIVRYELWKWKQCSPNASEAVGSTGASDASDAPLLIKTIRSDEFESFNGSFVYLDNSRDILPFTCYQYQLRVFNHKFSAFSASVTITTKPARPAGLQAPVAIAYNSTHASVSWLPPTRTNGILTSYLVSIGNLIRIQITNTSLNSIVVSDLTPFTKYNVTVTACTDGGCSESPLSSFTTEPANPDGLLPPVVTAISQNYVSISWSMPSQPNGPIGQFELLRMTIARPLGYDPVGLGTWFSAYSGESKTFEDMGLDTFTTYVYRLNFFNGYGRVLSGNSSFVTTFSGVPEELPKMKVIVFNISLVRLSWEMPEPKLVQGRVDNIEIKIFEGSLDSNSTFVITKNVTLIGGPKDDVPNHEDIKDQLQPQTLYLIDVTFTMYGGGSYAAPQINFTTPDGVPEGLSPPTFKVINDWSIQIFWEEAKVPKAAIVAYFILINGQKVDPKTNQSGSYLLENLSPYTVYNISIEACTEYACALSPPSVIATSESIPEFMEAPKVVEEKENHFIEITWEPPRQRNGIILAYELYKKQRYSTCIRQPLADIGGCKYVSCDVLQSFCGDRCYSGYKTCCNGKLHSIKAGYECCGSAYIPRKQNESDVCCGGEFRQKRENFRCCSGWYVEVLPGQICCKDPNEDRVVVDYGDACCGSFPYQFGGAQLCCGGLLYSRLSSQCCGDKVVDSSLACCTGYRSFFANDNLDNESLTNDGMSHKWFTSREGFRCCGLDYVDIASTVCCTDESGRWKVHTVQSGNQSVSTLSEIQKCCGTELISDSLSCCGGFSYNNQVDACANVDSSGAYSGCGHGKICSRSSQNSKAICGICDFDSVGKLCYVTRKMGPSGEDSADELIFDSTKSALHEGCFGPDLLLYSGLNLGFKDSSIQPYTRYSYHVIAINSVGMATSNDTDITTSPGIPQDVLLPELQTDPENPFFIALTWFPPRKPNGPILWYAVIRDSFEISWVSNLSTTSYELQKYYYLDTNAVVPFRIYNYVIQACTVAGCNNSENMRAVTKQGPPDPFDLPLVKSVNSTALEVKWYDPIKPNGLINRYVLAMVRPRKMQVEIKNSIEGSDYVRTNHSYVVKDLSPFTSYYFDLSICTEAGCTTSGTFVGTTSAGRPSGLQPPLLLFISQIPTVEISWSFPIYPNGNPLQIGVERSFGGLDFVRIFSTSIPTVQTYNDTNVRLGSQYIYRIFFINSVGTGVSSQSAIFIPNSVPDILSKIINVSVLSDTAILVTWSAARGNSTQPGSYNLLVITNNTIYAMVTKIEDPNSNVYSLNITNLKPYTTYVIRIQSCISNSSNSCGTSQSQAKIITKPAPPLDLASPKVKAFNSFSILISWNPPNLPNGPLVNYLLYRSNNIIKNQSSSSSVSSEIFPSEILIAHLTPNITEFLDAGPELLPYSIFKYRIVAIGVAGEVLSDFTEVQTLEAPPEVQSEPEVMLVSSVEAEACWDPPLKPNGLIIRYILTFKLISLNEYNKNLALLSVRLNGTTLCANVTGLMPNANYTAKVTALNGAGSVSSNWCPPITTLQSSPAVLEPPSTEAIIGGRSVVLAWKEPKYPNGIIIYYKAYLKMSADITANESNLQEVIPDVVYKGLNFLYEAGNLQPYTRYLSRIEACTAFGCSKSPWKEFITASAIPPNPPEISRMPQTSSSGVILQWTIPSQTYGPLSRLEIYRSNSSLSGNNSGDVKVTENARVKRSADEEIFELIYILELYDTFPNRTFSYEDRDVQPYNLYRYFLRMHNKAGYVDSPKVEATTPQSPPAFVDPPSVELIPFQFDKLLITWTQPLKPNGIIKSYQLNRSDLDITWYFPSNATLRFVDSGLSAYTTYSYAVTACSEGGCTSSNYSHRRTLETAPKHVDPPQIVTSTPFSLTVNWSAPEITNGEINRYELRIDSRTTYSGPMTFYEIKDLSPYTFYSLSLLACTAGGCTESLAISAITDQSLPELLDPPSLIVMSAESIKVTWKSPVRPNGPMVQFELRRNGTLIDAVTPEKTEGNSTHDASGINSKAWTFLDNNLSPATVYSYEVSAYNPIGKVSSPSSIARTPASAPIGVSLPLLQAISSTSILASWNPPLIPNGAISSYGLYIRSSGSVFIPSSGGRVKRDVTTQDNDSKLVYRGLGLSTNVTGLQPFNKYFLSLQACTSEGCSFSGESQVDTLADIPERQSPPMLQSFFNANNSNLGILPQVEVLVTWTAPEKINGPLLQYMLFRRLYDTGVNTDSTGKFLYAGLSLNFTDLDPSLVPFTLYEYRVVVVNSIGNTSSDWKLIRVSEGKPGNILPPLIQNVTSRDAVIIQDSPLSPNGEILNYTLFLEEIPKMVSSQSQFILLGLSPAIKYSLRIRMCNIIACVSGPIVEFTTKSEPPQGLAHLIFLNPSSNSIFISWHEPPIKNGFNLSYQLFYRTTCPLPYSITDASLDWGFSCDIGSFLIGYQGSLRGVELSNLIPFTKYELQLTCCNEAGCNKESTFTEITTSASAPLYRFGHPPTVKLQQNYLTIDWSESFYPNGPIKSFSIFKEGLVQYVVQSLTFVDRIQENKDYKYKISLSTVIGSVTSPDLLYNSSASFLKELIDTNAGPENDTVTPILRSNEIYREKWFIIMLAVPASGIFIIILFLLIFCCIKRKKQKANADRNSQTSRRVSSSSTNGLVYQVPVDFQEYASPAFSDDWSSEVSSVSARNSLYKNGPYGKPEELNPWSYLKNESDDQERRSGNPPLSPASSSGESLTVAEIIRSESGRKTKKTNSSQRLPDDDSDRLHIPEVTMPGVDEEEEDDSGLQSFVEEIIFKDKKGSGKLPDSKI